MDIEAIAQRVAAFSKEELTDKAEGFWAELMKDVENLKGNMENPWDDVDYDKCMELCKDITAGLKHIKSLGKDIKGMK